MIFEKKLDFLIFIFSRKNGTFNFDLFSLNVIAMLTNN